MTSTYLDYNASAPLRVEARTAMLDALADLGNPSSVHAAGRKARARVEKARLQVARLVGRGPDSVIFTAGGTEANNLAIQSAVASGSRRLVVSAIEHDSVLEPARRAVAATEIWPVTTAGLADLDWLKARLSNWTPDDGRPFVALMLANNETGIIQPVAEAAELVHQAGGWLHVDAVQAAGKMALNMAETGADSLALSAHKLGAPQGVGALVFGPGSVMVRHQHGGGQERGRRAGTENVAGIAGFGAVAELGIQSSPPAWRDAAARRLVTAGAIDVGAGCLRLDNTLCLVTPDYAADLQVMGLDLAGIMVSSGSACASGKVAPSHVLAAMNLGDLAGNAIRVSGGFATTEEDWIRFADAWLELYSRHQTRRHVSAA